MGVLIPQYIPELPKRNVRQLGAQSPKARFFISHPFFRKIVRFSIVAIPIPLFALLYGKYNWDLSAKSKDVDMQNKL